MIFLYNTMMYMHKNIHIALIAFTLVCVPVAAHAYLNPYDVLLSNETLLPAAPRDAIERIERQQEESAARRDREQTEIFAEQHPAAPEEETDFTQDADWYNAATLPSEVNYEFNALLRTLERISDTQAEAKAKAQLQEQAYLLLQQEGIVLHGGAPVLSGKGTGLAPTGAGTAMAILALFTAIAWTVRRAWRSGKFVQAHSS